MRAGSLDTWCEVLELHPVTLAPQVVAAGWFSIRQRQTEYKDVQPTGLRNRASVIGRCWFDHEVLPGRYVRPENGRLFVIDAVRDPLNNQSELSLAITELIGERAVYRSGAQPGKPVRAFFDVDAPHLADSGRMEYRHRIEVALIECGRPQPGDEIDLRGVTWVVREAVAQADNGILRDLWVRPK
jgi:hypothetical protein